MRLILSVFFLGITLSNAVVSAQEPPNSQCLNLAHKFSENPQELALQELERLRFCINQAVEHREQSMKGELLKGTIIEPSSSTEDLTGSPIPKIPNDLNMQ